MHQIINTENILGITSRGGILKVFISPKTAGSTRLIMGSAALLRGEVIHEHVHDYGEETFLVTEGQGFVTIDDAEYEIGAGDAVIIKQGQRHQVINKHCDLLQLVFACAPLAPSAKEGHRNSI